MVAESRRLLVLMPLGSEVRQFGHSGLMTSLLDRGWDVVVAAKTVDDDLRRQLDERARLVSMPSATRSNDLAQLETILDKAHSVRERRGGRSTWQFAATQPKNRKQAALFKAQDLVAELLGRSGTLAKLGAKGEARLQRSRAPVEWVRLFDELEPSVVLTNVPRVLEPALSVARSRNLPTIILYHTAKDVSAFGRLNHDFSRIGVWNDRMRSELLRQNPRLDRANIRVIGCGHFDCVGRADLLRPETELRRALGARPQSKLILFPASAPWVVPGEERYLELILGMIRRSGRDAQLVVRLNPMDHTTELVDSIRRRGLDVLVSKPDWRWDRSMNWCFQRREDLSLFNSLLHYSQLCIGAPSTVAIECAVERVPLINLGFDLEGPKPLNGSIAAAWNQEFYRDVRETRAAELASSEALLSSLISRGLDESKWMREEQARLLLRQLGVAPGSSTRGSIELIEAATQSRGAI